MLDTLVRSLWIGASSGGGCSKLSTPSRLRFQSAMLHDKRAPSRIAGSFPGNSTRTGDGSNLIHVGQVVQIWTIVG